MEIKRTFFLIVIVNVFILTYFYQFLNNWPLQTILSSISNQSDVKLDETGKENPIYNETIDYDSLPKQFLDALKMAPIFLSSGNEKYREASLRFYGS